MFFPFEEKEIESGIRGKEAGVCAFVNRSGWQCAVNRSVFGEVNFQVPSPSMMAEINVTVSIVLSA